MLLSCAIVLLLLTGATATAGSFSWVTFQNRLQDNVIFTQNLMYETQAWSKVMCSQHCSTHPGCVTFTFTEGSSGQGTCRGHSTWMTNNAAVNVTANTTSFQKDQYTSQGNFTVMTEQEITTSYQMPEQQVRCWYPGVQQKVVPSLNLSVEVYCDQDLWLHLARRQDGSENFTRGWQDYTSGFGDRNGEFFIGLDAVHKLTGTQAYNLTVELGDWNDTVVFATYSNFSVDGPTAFYALHANYTGGTVNDSLALNSGYAFTTIDNDHDQDPARNCAITFKGGWWFVKCGDSNLFGDYIVGGDAPNKDGVRWKKWYGTNYSLKYAVMKIKPA